MLALEEHQFEILPSITATGGVGFGIGMSVSVDEDGFQPGDDEWSDQDSESPTRGTTFFGRDTLTGPTWAWDLHVNEYDVPSALATLSEIRTAWRALAIKDKPGAVLPLRYRVGDRVRRIYGRPRRFSAPPNNRILGGFIPITCDFKCVDAFTYDDVASSTTLGLGNISEGGMTFPVTFAVQTSPAGSQQSSVVVGGDAPTYPVVRFDGPITNPYLETNDWRIDLDLSLADTEHVVVDLRPWALTVLKNGNQNVAGALGRRQWLADMKFEPGQHPIGFGGVSATGGGTCTVSWRSAYHSY